MEGWIYNYKHDKGAIEIRWRVPKTVGPCLGHSTKLQSSFNLTTPSVTKERAGCIAFRTLYQVTDYRFKPNPTINI